MDDFLLTVFVGAKPILGLPFLTTFLGAVVVGMAGFLRVFPEKVLAILEAFLKEGFLITMELSLFLGAGKAWYTLREQTGLGVTRDICEGKVSRKSLETSQLMLKRHKVQKGKMKVTP